MPAGLMPDVIIHANKLMAAVTDVVSGSSGGVECPSWSQDQEQEQSHRCQRPRVAGMELLQRGLEENTEAARVRVKRLKGIR